MPIRKLSKELRKKSEVELNESSARLEQDLKCINEWRKKVPHLNIPADDQWLIAFLRGCKFNLQRTKEKLDLFYTTRTLAKDLFRDRDPFSSDIQEVLKAGAILPLPTTKSSLDPRVILIRWETCNPDNILLVTLVKTLFMIVDILLNEDDNFVVSGLYFWLEFKGFSLNYIWQFTPNLIQKCLALIQNTYPIRPKVINCTNVPSAFEVVFNIIRSFANKKIKNRMKLYSEANSHEVYENISYTIIPKEYGGDGISVNELGARWKKNVEDYRESFLEDAQFGANEKLKNVNLNGVAQVIGLEGTFRKLDID